MTYQRGIRKTMDRENLLKPLPKYLEYEFILYLYYASICFGNLWTVLRVSEYWIRGFDIDDTEKDLHFMGTTHKTEDFSNWTDDTRNNFSWSNVAMSTAISTFHTFIYQAIIMQCIILFLLFQRASFVRRRMELYKNATVRDKNLVRTLEGKMADFSSGVQIMRKAANDISRLNSIPNNPLLEGLSHENLLLYRVPSYGEHISLRKFMLCQKIQWIDTLEVAAMVNFIEGVLRAVHYLHQHNIYHLDLQPSNIIIKKTGFMKYTAQVGGFEFVKQKEKVFREEIGLNDLYRPPECYSNEVVDAAKVDCWGLGIVALEVFTGGMLTIEADSKGSSDVRGAELIRVLKMLDPRYFASAMSAAGRAWTEGVDFDLERAHFLHDINDTEFVPLCWSLTRELLRPDPGRRCTPKQALDSIPMQPNIYLATDSYFRQRCPKRPFERKGKYVRA